MEINLMPELMSEEEREILKKKYENQEFYFSYNGGLSRYGWGENFLHVGMNVKVKKPDNTWRKGVIEYITIENNIPKIGVICGSKSVKFEKTWGEVIANERMREIILWETIEVPERLKKMDTFKLLKEYRKKRKYIRNTKEEACYKKELCFREHVGPTDKKTVKIKRQNKAKMKW